NRANIPDRADAATHGERDEDAVGHAADHVGHDLAPVGRSRDVQKDQLVGALAVISGALFDRVPGVDQIDEADAFDHATAVNVETRNDALSQHFRSRIAAGLSHRDTEPQSKSTEGGFHLSVLFSAPLWLCG